MDCSPPGFLSMGILQARILEWVAISFVTPWTVAYQGSPGKNAGVGCHFLLQGIFPTQGWNMSLSLLRWQADSLPLHHLRGYSVMCANFNICISFNRFVSLLWVLFFHLFASLVIFEWMPRMKIYLSRYYIVLCSYKTFALAY